MSRKTKEKKPGKGKWAVIYILTFVVALIAGVLSKQISPSWAKDYSVKWTDEVGTAYKDLSYGDLPAKKYDIYVPADNTKESYGLIVYLHPGGFTSGDKQYDHEMLEWLCSMGYVTAGINYTLRDDEHPETSVYSQSIEIKAAVPVVIEEAEKLGYHIDSLGMAGGSAGHCLAMLYAYRDADTSPVPVKVCIGAVGPSSFYPEDWSCHGFDARTEETDEAAAGLFGIMAGKKITPDMFGTPAYDEAMKDISALLWVDEHTVPTLLCYGAYDRVQSFEASKRLDAALTEYGVPHDYIVCEHSGHGLQNDSESSHRYSQLMVEYLDRYMPVR